MIFNRLVAAQITAISTPTPILIGSLLKETALLAEALVDHPQVSIDSITPSALKESLRHLTCIQLNPLVSSLGVDVSTLQKHLSTGFKKKPRVFTRIIEDFVLDSLVHGGINCINAEDQEDLLRTEIFAYLEVATGLPRVLKRCITGNELPLFSLPLSVEHLRLLCLVFLRGTVNFIKFAFFELWQVKCECHVRLLFHNLIY